MCVAKVYFQVSVYVCVGGGGEGGGLETCSTVTMFSINVILQPTVDVPATGDGLQL